MTPEDLKRILFGIPSEAFNIPDRNGLRLPELRKMPDNPHPPLPEPRNDIQDKAVEDFGVMITNRGNPSRLERSVAAPMEFRTNSQPNFEAATQNQNDGANGLKGIVNQFDADWQAGAPARQAAQAQQRVAQAERQTQSIEEALMGKTANLQGMSNRNIRAYNGGGPTPGAVGDQAMAMNQADIRKQLAGMNPSVDQLSPLQMRGEVDRPPEDTRDMSPQGVQDRLRAAFGATDSERAGGGKPRSYDTAPDRSGKPNPFFGYTRSDVDENGNASFTTKYLDEEAMRAANKELMAKRRAAPAQARLNQLQFTQKQLANALSGKPIDDLPDGLSADAANELVRGSARMYRRGENMKTFQDLLAQGLSPDPNPRVREQFAEGALAAKRGQVDADLRAKLAGQQMEQQAIEGDKNRANRLELGKMDADAQMAAANSRGGGDTAEMKFAATKLRIEQELANPKLTPDERRQLENEYRQLLGRQPMAPLPPPAPPKPSIVERIVAGDRAAAQPTPDYAVGLAPSTESGRKMGASLMQRIFGPY